MAQKHAQSDSASALKAELEFTMQKIDQNFSNYSAWHQRSTLIPTLFESAQDLRQALQNELEIVQQAFYTEPKDQSAWIYYRWLLGLSSALQAPRVCVCTASC